MAREADLLLPTHAGPEIGVASTKAFTCQLAVLAALAVNLARAKNMLADGEEKAIVRHLAEAPAALHAALAQDRSEGHTSELQSLMRNSYAVFRLKTNTQLASDRNDTQQNSKTKHQQQIPSPHWT